MARCGCGRSAACSCVITGSCATQVTGNGSADAPYVISSERVRVAATDSPTVDHTLVETTSVNADGCPERLYELTSVVIFDPDPTNQAGPGPTGGIFVPPSTQTGTIVQGDGTTTTVDSFPDSGPNGEDVFVVHAVPSGTATTIAEGCGINVATDPATGVSTVSVQTAADDGCGTDVDQRGSVFCDAATGELYVAGNETLPAVNIVADGANILTPSPRSSIDMGTLYEGCYVNTTCQDQIVTVSMEQGNADLQTHGAFTTVSAQLKLSLAFGGPAPSPPPFLGGRSVQVSNEVARNDGNTGEYAAINVASGTQISTEQTVLVPPGQQICYAMQSEIQVSGQMTASGSGRFNGGTLRFAAVPA